MQTIKQTRSFKDRLLTHPKYSVFWEMRIESFLCLIAYLFLASLAMPMMATSEYYHTIKTVSFGLGLIGVILWVAYTFSINASKEFAHFSSFRLRARYGMYSLATVLLSMILLTDRFLFWSEGTRMATDYDQYVFNTNVDVFYIAIAFQLGIILSVAKKVSLKYLVIGVGVIFPIVGLLLTLWTTVFFFAISSVLYIPWFSMLLSSVCCAICGFFPKATV